MYFTCDLEGALPCPGFVDDITGVLPPAVPVQVADGILCLILVRVEGPSVKQSVGQQPLKPQHTGRVSAQDPARHHYGTPQSLPHLHKRRLHCRRV